MPIIGQRVTSFTEQPSPASLTAVSGAAASCRSSITTTDPDGETLPVATSSHVTQFPVSQPGSGCAVWPCQPSRRYLAPVATTT